VHEHLALEARQPHDERVAHRRRRVAGVGGQPEGRAQVAQPQLLGSMVGLGLGGEVGRANAQERRGELGLVRRVGLEYLEGPFDRGAQRRYLAGVAEVGPPPCSTSLCTTARIPLWTCL